MESACANATASVLLDLPQLAMEMGKENDDSEILGFPLAPLIVFPQPYTESSCPPQ